MQPLVRHNVYRYQDPANIYYSGGLGLTSGIVDVGNLYDCLIGIYDNKATDDILVKYSEVRRDMYIKVIGTVSSSNFRRMFDDPETVLENDDFLQMCNRAETDTELACQIQKVGIHVES